MDIYSEGGLIFLIMVDHLNGELLGGVIDSFYAAGEDPETIGKGCFKGQDGGHGQSGKRRFQHLRRIKEGFRAEKRPRDKTPGKRFPALCR